MSAVALTPEQVEQRTGVAKKTLSNWRALGVGPAHFKIGRLVRYWEADIDAWLLEQSKASAS